MTVTVTLSADPKRPLTIPVTNTAQGTTTADYYTFTATDVTFASGQMSRTLTFTADQDSTADHGDSVKLGFGTDLPPGVTEGTDDETTVTIIGGDLLRRRERHGRRHAHAERNPPASVVHPDPRRGPERRHPGRL